MISVSYTHLDVYKRQEQGGEIYHMCASKYNNYLTENEKTQILFYYNIGWSTTMIGKKLNRSDSSIGRFLNKKNLKPKNNHNGLLDAEIEDIVNLYKAGKTANEILQKYNNKIKCRCV